VGKTKLQAGMMLDTMSTAEQAAQFDRLCAELRALRAPDTIVTPGDVFSPVAGVLAATLLYRAPETMMVNIHRIAAVDSTSGVGLTSGTLAFFRNAQTLPNYVEQLTVTAPTKAYGSHSAIVLRSGDSLLVVGTGLVAAPAQVAVTLQGAVHDVVGAPVKVTPTTAPVGRPVPVLGGSPTPTWPRTAQPGPATVPASGFGREGRAQ
jgi:hypothetical protein